MGCRMQRPATNKPVSGGLVLGDLQDDPSLIGADRLGVATRVQGKHPFLEIFGKSTALEVFQVAARSGSRAVRVLLGQVLELATLFQQVVNLVGLGLGR